MSYHGGWQDRRNKEFGDIWLLTRVFRELNDVPVNSLPWMKLRLLKVPPPPTAHAEDQASDTQSQKAHSSHMQPTEKPTSGVLAVGCECDFRVFSLLEIVSASPSFSVSVSVSLCLCLSHTDPGL